MKHHKQQTKPSNMNDIAILFLRFFIGAIICLHLIGQMQTYTNVVNHFPSVLGLDGATSFAIVAILKALFAVMIIIGISTRFASSMMLIIASVSIVDAMMPLAEPTERAKLDFVYMGIYLTLVISGGGYYSFNLPKWLHNRHKGTQ
jgi:putative oxidoreductase